MIRVLSGVEIPPKFQKAQAALLNLVETQPGKLTLFDGTRMLKLIGIMSPTMLFTESTQGRAVCGLLPILRWVDSGAATLKLGRRTLSIADLRSMK